MDTVDEKSSILLLALGNVSEHVQRFYHTVQRGLSSDARVSAIALSCAERSFCVREAQHLLHSMNPLVLVSSFADSWPRYESARLLSTLRRLPWNGKLMAVLSGSREGTATAEALLKSGADDALELPEEFSSALPRVGKLFRTAAVRSREENVVSEAVASLIGKAASFQAVLEKLPSIARSNATVLITGETGTGKGLVAEAIRNLGPGSEKPFVKVQCGALPERLVENELFGHAPGAYTDAAGSQVGMVAQAEGGTLFLDEIDALPLSTQAKLLQLVEDREYRPLGTGTLCKVNARIIATSNADLESLVEERSFRRDLFYRLNVVRLHLPSLAERREDIPLLVEHFLRKHAEPGDRFFSLTPSAMHRLQERTWSGNVRELEYMIKRTLLFACHSQLDESDFGLVMVQNQMPALPFNDARAQAIAAFERAYLVDALNANGWNMSQAARASGKDARVFRDLMRRHKISDP